MKILHDFSGKISKLLLFFVTFLLLGVGIFLLFFLANPPAVSGIHQAGVVREIAANGAFELHFSEPMEKKSTESAISFLPEIEGNFVWDNAKTVRFSPTSELPLDKKIIMNVNQTAKSRLFKPLSTAIAMEYIVVSVPEMTMLSPISVSDWNIFLEKKEGKNTGKQEKEAVLIKKNQPITVMFDRPVRPLGDDPNTFDPADYLEFSVPVTGSSKWLGTSAFEYRIDEKSWPNAMDFSVHLKPGMPTIDGGKTTDEIEWSMYTAAPKLMSVSAGEIDFYTRQSQKNIPDENTFFEGTNILPDSRVVLEWNMPVELESFFKHLEIKPARAVKDDLIIQDQGDKHFVYLEFTPPLARNEKIEISIAPGVEPLHGKRISEHGTEVIFSTLSHSCLQLLGEKNEAVEFLEISPNDTLEFEFCSLMEGSSITEFSEKNQEEALEKSIIIKPKVEQESIDFSCYSSECDLTFDAVPNTKYDISFASNITDILGQKIPVDTFAATVQVGDYAPLLSPMTRGGMRSVMDNAEDMGVFFSARNVPEVLVKTCLVPAQKVAEIESEGGWGWHDFSCSQGSSLLETTQELPQEKNGMFVFEIDTHAEREKNDIVFWQVSSPLVKNPWNNEETRIFSGVIFPANATLTAKNGHNFIQVWATDFVTGSPLSDLPLQFFGHGGTLLSTEKTDSNGLVRFEKPEGENNFFIRSSSFSVSTSVGSGWDSGISPWDFGINFDWTSVPKTTGVAFTDRPIYRPNHEVHFKGILRQDFDAAFFLPEEKTVRVIIHDSKGDKIFDEEKFLSDFGSLSGSLTLAENSPTGRYFLSVREAGSDDSYEQFAQAVFWVEEYKKPVFKVSLNAEKEEFIRGDEINLTLNSEYFFGSAVQNADVSWHVVSTPLVFDRWGGTGWFSFGFDEGFCYWECSKNEEVVTDGEGKTDEKGNFSFRIPAENEKHSLYTVRATVVSTDNQSVTGTKTFPVFAGESVLGIRSNDFYLDASAANMSAEAVISDLSGKGVSGKRFTATLQKVLWNSIKKQGVDGAFYWENTEEIIDLDVISASTGVGGKTEISFPLKDQEDYFGQLRILVSLDDSRGNAVSAATIVWRSSAEYPVSGRQENSPRFSLTLESPEVEVGENIIVLPESPFAEAIPALVTVERQEILFQKVISLIPGQPLAFSATEEMIPNAFVSVILSKGKGDMGKIAPYVRIYHSTKEDLEKLEEKRNAAKKKIDTVVEKMSTAELETLEPLEKGLETYRAELASLDAQKEEKEDEQKKAKGEIFLVLGEDAPIPSLESSLVRPEQKIGMVPVKVSAEDRRLSVKIIPEHDEYLPGEKVNLSVEVTDSLGQPVPSADVSVAVVDESLLALKSRQDEDIFEVFYRIRNLGIRTMSTMTQFAHRLNVRSQNGEKGGGGLGNALDLLERKRGEFRDTAFWVADAQTNGKGSADISFTLPDNATTWQVWTTVNTIDSQFGGAKKNFLSRKPLLVSPLLPRFLIAGDTAQIGFSMHNQTDSDLIVRPEFTAENIEILQKNNESFRIPAGGSKSVFFGVRAGFERDERTRKILPALITMSALGDESDAIDTVEISLPLLPPATANTFATSGIITPESSVAQEKIYVSENIFPDMGGIFVSLSSGILGNVSQALSSLAQYPYGCAEQIMSAHLPNIALLSLQKETGLSVFPEDFDMKKATSLALQELYSLQQRDGGFGFWKQSNRSYPFLTAYILFGLEQTKAAGHTVDEHVLKNARAYLSLKILEDIRTLDSFPAEQKNAFADYNARAFAAYSLTLGSKLDSSIISHLYERRFSLSSEGKAFLLLAALNTFEADSESNVSENLVKLLEAEVWQEDRTAFFSAGKNHWNFSSDIRSTAVVALALQKYDVNHPLAPKLMQFLRDIKSHQSLGGPWGTTQDTAWALLAFAEFSRTHVAEDSAVMLSLNLEKIFDDTIQQNGVSSDISIPVSSLKKGVINTLDFSAQDSLMTYDVVYTGFVPSTEIAARNEGFGIVREYSLKDDGEQTPVSAARVGDIVRGKITLLLPENRYFTGVTVPLPAGLEAINFALETEDSSLQKTINTCDHFWCPENDLWRFSHREYRDDHVFLFADYLPAGRYEFEFLARATTAGTFTHLPARAEEIYHPEVFGRTEGGEFEVR